MTAPVSDPTFIKNKERFFIEVAKTVAKGSTHPAAGAGCILVRDREIVGAGRSILTASKIEIDCITVAIGATSKCGTPTLGAVIYTTRYPYTTPIFQCYQMGIKKVVFLAHEWEPFYKDEYRRAARLARELSISLEPFHEDADPRFEHSPQPFEADYFQPDNYDPQHANDVPDEDSTDL